MLDLTGMDTFTLILLLIGVCGAASWGLTQVVKSAILAWEKTHADSVWFNPVLRALAVITGGVMGYFLMPEALGVGIGIGSGALNTYVVSILKARGKKLVDGDEDAVPPAACPPEEGEVRKEGK